MKELDEYRSVWKKMEDRRIIKEEIAEMIHESSHPILRAIRRQLVIEAVLLTIFLVVFYTMFDGNRKPFSLNLLLVFSLILAITHNVIGYTSNRNLIMGNNLKISLENRVLNMKRYARMAVAARLFSNFCMIAFFSSTISFTTAKYGMLACMVLFTLVQAVLAYRIWKQRIKELTKSIAELAISVR